MAAQPSIGHTTLRTFPLALCIQSIIEISGLVSFFRRFIPKFSNIALPITNLLKDTVTFEWSKECAEAFETLKKRLVKKYGLCGEQKEE